MNYQVDLSIIREIIVYFISACLMRRLICLFSHKNCFFICFSIKNSRNNFFLIPQNFFLRLFFLFSSTKNYFNCENPKPDILEWILRIRRIQVTWIWSAECTKRSDGITAPRTGKTTRFRPVLSPTLRNTTSSRWKKLIRFSWSPSFSLFAATYSKPHFARFVFFPSIL